ncbi:IPT/TIG domain-containing protein [Labedella endophytica]|uniref:IPT/TIG domain-containing protein n=1 Tax=Labedella endophytica TaxID=1523160 RepID=A0A3S0XNI4_9MICO|nr:IPT/TIG domain-containing protein [Labedella endophytica]RUR01400.1 hypothetical protein ELQ94_07820 [Labedella endophytica]
MLSATVVATLFAAAGAGAAVAAPGDRAQAEALFLSGDGLVDLDDIAELDGPYSQFTPGGAENAPLDVTVLSLIDIGLGLQLFGGNDVLDLGATGQYAETGVDGAVAASGLITGTGAIVAGNGSLEQQTTLDLGPVLDAAAADDLISTLSLELGALSARAESSRGSDVTTTSDYQVASGVLRLQSPALGDLTTGLDGTLADTSATVNAIAGTDGAISDTSAQLIAPIQALLRTLLGLVTLSNAEVTSTLNVDLGTALDAATADAFVSGPVTIDLGTGEILIDLDELYALNDLAPNTQLLDDPAINAQITAAISDILTDQLPEALVDAVTDVLNSTTLAITINADASLPIVGGIGVVNTTITGSLGGFLGNDGQPAPDVDLAGTSLVGLPVGTLLTPLTTLVTDTLVPDVLAPVVATAVDLDGLEVAVTAVATTAVTALSPLLDLVNDVVSVTLNVQEQPGAFRDPAGTDAASFTQTAVRVEVLPGLADVVTLNLASATVTAVPLAVPTIGTIDPDRGPVTGGTEVTITGTGFEDVAGADAVLFDGDPAASYTVVSDTEITAVTPPHAPATVDVTITNPDGVSTPGEFTFFPLTEVTGIDPGFGDEDGGTLVTITGSCFTGATGVLFGTTPGTEFEVVDDTTITVISPAGEGTVDVTVQNPTECGDGTLEDAFTFVPDGAAVIDGIDPDRGPEVGGTEVTITGSGFDDTEEVLFDGEPAADFDIISDTEILAVSPPHVPATVGVQVVTDVGASAPADFEYYAVTAVDAIDPEAGPIAGGTDVTITGSCFTGATDVLFGDESATSFTVVSDTEITAVTPAGDAIGAVDVTVVGAGDCADGGPDGPGTLPDGFSYLAVPATTELDPDRGPVTGGTEVTITGTGFTGVTEVTFGGEPGTELVVVSDTEITVTSPAGGPGTVDVVVTSPVGSSAALPFEYFPVTVVTAIDPETGDEAGGTAVTITGDAFTGATGVTFDGVPATEFVVVDDETITAVTPAGVGTVDVVVLNPGEAGDGALEDGFEYLPPVAPTLTELDPDRGPEGGDTLVIVTGTDFDGTTSVTVDGIEADFDVVSDTELTFTTPPHAPETVDVIVTNEVGPSAPLDFTYFATAEVDEVDPDEGPLAGGSVVTITGSCFTGATGVLFGDVPATVFSVVSDTEITVLVPAGVTAGAVDVTVIGGGECGDATLPGGYTYLDAPAIAALDPERGPVTGGTEVTITGTGFTGTTTVLFGGFAGTELTVVSDTEITVTTPSAAAPGPVQVVVFAGGGASEPGEFTYFAVAEITAVTPASGEEPGGETVTITGSCFTGATGVLFGDEPATDVVVVDDGTITAVTPAGIGTVDVTVVNPGECGDATLEDAFTYVPEGAPVLTAIDPDRGPEVGGTAVTITGTGLDSTTSVTIDGEEVGFTIVDDTEITLVTPPHAPETVDVVVTNAGGASAPLDFTYVGVTTVDTVTPDEGPLAGGTGVTIIGSCFTDATAVLFGDVPATDVVVVSDTVITATAPASIAVGSVDVTVVGAGECGLGGEDGPGTLPDGFEYLAAPLVTELDPERGPVTGGTEVTITGTGFTDATEVTFGGVPGTDLVVVSDTEITVTTPAGDVPGVVDVVVTAPSGVSEPGDFEYYPVAEIDDVAPNAGDEDGGTVVTITGSCFTGATDVLFGDTSAASITVVSDTEITATTPAGVGTVDVTVVNPTECGDGTIEDAFTFVPDGAATIDALEPDRGPSVGGTEVTVTGAGFDDAEEVLVDGVAVPEADVTIVSDTELVFVTPAHAPETVNVQVVTDVGASAPSDFTYFDVTTIEEVDPEAGPEAGGNTVTITGSCFTGATAVLFGDTPATSFTVVSDTEITAVAPAGTPGLVDITVVGAGDCAEGGDDGPGTIPDGYEYLAAPSISGLEPIEGPVTGGTTVTITGEDFLDVTGTEGVTFDGEPAAEYTVVSDTEITAVTPPHAVGPVDVIVTGPGGASDPAEFTYVAVTVIETVTPNAGAEEGGTLVTIEGSCFTGTSEVLFGGVPGTGLTVVDDGLLTVVTPAGTGIVDVTVVNPTACGGATAEDAFTFVPEGAPVIESLDPDRGPVTGGTEITITGEGFDDVIDVLIDGESAPFIEIVSDTEILVITPEHAAGTVPVTLITFDGPSAPADFTFFDVTTVDAVDPSEGPLAGGEEVTITGSCFTGVTRVEFGGVPADFVVVSDTEITAVVPAGTVAGAVDVTVTGFGECAVDGPAVLPDGYLYTAPPVVTSITPDRGPVAGGTLVTITGEGLGDATAVTFDGIEGTGLNDPTALPEGTFQPFAIISDEVITVYSPAHPVGTVDLVVIDPDGSSEPVDFTYFGEDVPGPIDPEDPDGTDVDVVTPPRGPSSGGTTVTITGSCFTGATAVLFGNTPARSVTVISDTEIRAVSPAGSGSVDVTVVGSTECGSATLSGGFTYTSGLAVTGSDAAGLGLLAALLLLVGGAGAWFSRRRNAIG